MVPEILPQQFSDYRTYTDQFLNKRGKKLFCYYWEPTEKPRGLLLICHGYTDHTMMYESLAKQMVRKGFFVFGNDHVGHGRSGGQRAFINNIHSLVDDTASHIMKMRTKYPDLPFFLWGHSMGGAVCFLTSLQKKTTINGLVAVAPALAPNPETATPVRVGIAKVFGYVLPQFPVAFAEVALSCRDEEQIRQLNADPLRHHGYFKARAVMSLLKTGEEIMKNKELVDVPYLMFHGDDDKVCDISGPQSLHSSSSSKDKTFVTYAGAYHSLFQEPAEVSNDVLSKSVQWLDERA